MARLKRHGDRGDLMNKEGVGSEERRWYQYFPFIQLSETIGFWISPLIILNMNVQVVRFFD